MESSIVIKVKYEETLRRFNARVGDQELDLNMDRLRDKIFQLFNFAPEAELTFTYADEDGDDVTLVDDEDLQDAMRQNLNPLRILVRSSAPVRSGKPSARSSGNSTPRRSPHVHAFSTLNSGVSDVLKNVPEPLREAVIKLYSELTSRASSSAPILAELVDGISKMGMSYYQNQASGSQPVKETSSYSGVSNENTMSADPNPQTSSKKNEPKAALNDELRTPKSPEAELDSLNALLAASAKLKAKSKEALGVDQSEILSPSTRHIVSLLERDRKSSDCHPGGKAFYASPFAFSYSGAPSVLPEKRSTEQPSKVQPIAKPAAAVPASSGKLEQGKLHSHKADPSGSSVKVPYDGLRSSASPSVPPKMNECPFSGVVNDNIPPQSFPFEVPLKRSHNHSDAAGTIFHRGVRCDGCGVHPITGPRFISKVKENYDLCSICFAEMGNDADYVRMDRPLPYRHPLSFKGLHDLHGRLRFPPVPRISRGHGLKPGRPKLDSRFIQDVNVLDGTLMAPLTRFTKIWRMRNNGNLIWPQGSQLVWIGGDKLSDQFSVELEITSAGLAVEQELDVAVDFTAPAQPGRYISYWKMASPSGQKFGQRVWVLIQVDASSNLPNKELVQEALQGLNLNFPPPGSVELGPDVINVNPEPQNVIPEPKVTSTKIELVESVADVNQNKEQEAKFPINDSLLVGVGGKSSSSASGSSITYPIIDLTEEVPAAASSVGDMQATLQDVKGDNEVEVSLLRELEQMGFKQIDLNKEILRKNEYDLEQSVDDLCGVSEWDPILEELEEMGFCDKEMNRKLLQKNNGSIKRVVMDLIAGEK